MREVEAKKHAHRIGGSRMIRFTKHAKDRLAEYGISEEDVENMLKEPEKVFLDLKTGRFAAVKRWKDKHLVIVFESEDELSNYGFSDKQNS